MPQASLQSLGVGWDWGWITEQCSHAAFGTGALGERVLELTGVLPISGESLCKDGALAVHIHTSRTLRGLLQRPDHLLR